tara:strand:- start:304 stop:774 length:471 start_codon:yes stop_codon:yes gene_type:complete
MSQEEINNLEVNNPITLTQTSLKEEALKLAKERSSYKVSTKTTMDWFIETMLDQAKPITRKEIVSETTLRIMLNDVIDQKAEGKKSVKEIDLKSPDQKELFWSKYKQVRQIVFKCMNKKDKVNSIFHHKKYAGKYDIIQEGAGKFSKYRLITISNN